ncbi:hypothetical protein F511_40895 [Dorcoceras hygrometricum]|uniref:RING-CH-type domain-containing protein n=1 Tax=Dorcoceras hygrometricum TaxID=472368 RepID=A0A2Z7A797_9LAMI|nr:hypothetical protein F511_40895 [Dorcoceras hygrometricum]
MDRTDTDAASGDDSRNSANLGSVTEEGGHGNTDPNYSKVNNAAPPVDEAERREDKVSSFVIDVNCDDADVRDNQRVCRICHLSSKEGGKSSMGLIQLGCGCRGELGFAHVDCAEAWFKVRGNRVCEICGETAKNIKGGSDYGLMEAWSDRSSTDASSASSEGSRRTFHYIRPAAAIEVGHMDIYGGRTPWI